jgi:hypothetical protein
VAQFENIFFQAIKNPDRLGIAESGFAFAGLNASFTWLTCTL